MTLVVATQNRAKLAELRILLAGLPIELLMATTVLPDLTPVLGDSGTFEDNAVQKALSVVSRVKLLTLADDGGLEIDALAGRPGVRSARFAKEGATDAENNAAVLAALEDVEDDERTARFRCALALIDPWSDAGPAISEGRCEGTIARQTRGGGGFGYDPLFMVNGYDRTMAELAEDERRLVSPRTRAMETMRPRIESLVRARLSSSLDVLAAGSPGSS